MSQKYHEDFGYYHLPFVLGLIEEKIIFGFSNIDQAYVYNSLWLNIYSIFVLEDKDFDLLTLPSFILYISFIIFSFNRIISKKNLITSDYYFFLITIFSIFSILIKLSTLPIILLSIYLYIKYFRELKFSIFNLKYILVYSLLIFFLVQQFIYTGCFFFPTKLTCLNVSWFNQEYLQLSQRLELVNKSYSLAREIYTPEAYLKNFNWIYFWFKRSLVEISEHLFTIIIPTTLFLLFLKKNKENIFFFKESIFIYIFLFAGLAFWLNFSPVYRFATHLFLTLLFMLFLNFFSSKQFSKKVFIIFFSVFILFNFSKNILRIYEQNDIYYGIQKIHNEYVQNVEYSNKHAKIYLPNFEKNSHNGWQGRLCWDIPFVCSYNNLEVVKKNGYLVFRKLKK